MYEIKRFLSLHTCTFEPESITHSERFKWSSFVLQLAIIWWSSDKKKAAKDRGGSDEIAIAAEDIAVSLEDGASNFELVVSIFLIALLICDLYQLFFFIHSLCLSLISYLEA